MIHRMRYVRRLTPQDLSLMRALNALFARAFGDPKSYDAAPPSDGWLRETLGKPNVIPLVVVFGGEVVAGLVAYELDKLEQARREIYIYDLAVAEEHRRKGFATALIERLRE